MDLPFRDIGSFYWWGVGTTLKVILVLLVFWAVVWILSKAFGFMLYDPKKYVAGKKYAFDKRNIVAIPALAAGLLFVWPLTWFGLTALIVAALFVFIRAIHRDWIREREEEQEQ